ncbi:DUF5674 family protein [Synechocystis sp. PCC 7509]|uniref:DUF5674 family protein n=1 Tax=Synechocystis sp. PCC 7509 TaxID=927677 RepID=UPI0002ABB7CC|nr:DUF5674 family protein [Synechocystis sp. PCC 7509]
MIILLRDRLAPEQIDQMLQAHGFYVKIAVDIERGIIAGGGELHADCEAVLLSDGSQQKDIWGANWNPLTQEVSFESLINIRPRQNNRSIEILDPNIKANVAAIVQKLIG